MAKFLLHDICFERKERADFLKAAHEEADRRWPEERTILVRSWGWAKAWKAAKKVVGEEWSWASGGSSENLVEGPKDREFTEIVGDKVEIPKWRFEE